MNKLRNFNGQECFAYQGMCDFPDGSKPLIAASENVTLLVGGYDSTEDFGITLIFPDDYEVTDAWKIYDDIKKAKADAMLLANVLDCGFTKENNWFRYRAAAIIIEDDSILFVNCLLVNWD
jgi:hypothetical protein